MASESPFLFPLAFVPWQIFGTLTFKGSVPRPAQRWSLLWRFQREGTADCHANYSHALIAVREEVGESRGREHFHYLLGGLPASVNLRSFCFRSRWRWKTLTGGMSRIYPYDDALSGVAYVLKGLCVTSGGRAYELGKFGKEVGSNSVLRELQPGKLMLSESVLRYLRVRLSII